MLPEVAPLKLYALFDQDDRYHLAVKAVQGMAETIVPDVVLVEADFLAHKSGGVPALVRFLQYFEAARFQLLLLNPSRIRRTQEILQAYASARFDFVDASLMAMAERLDIRQLCVHH